jgi:hypothetical protein
MPGTCDSGTVVQGDVNEAIGVPTAMLTAGARAVVGAAWPVARAAAVALCLQVLRGVAARVASPEALQRASSWVRDASVDTAAEALREVDHPLVRTSDFDRLLKAAPTKKWFASPHLWASYVHWGGGWLVGNGRRQAKPAHRAPPVATLAKRIQRAKPVPKAPAPSPPAKGKRRAGPVSKATSPGPTRSRAPRDVGGSFPAELVGQWMSGGFLYHFFPDGSYE